MKKRFLALGLIVTMLVCAFYSPFAAGIRSVSAENADADASSGEESSDYGDAILLIFDDEAKYERLFEGQATDIEDITYDSEKKCWVLSVNESTDPFIELLFGQLSDAGQIPVISTDKYKTVQIGVRFDTSAGREGQFYYQTAKHMNYQEPQNLSYVYANTDKPQYVNIDASGSANWSGNLADSRYDLLTASRTSVEFEIYYIGFFENTESADVYGKAWLKELGVEEIDDGPSTGDDEPKVTNRGPFGLVLFDNRAENVNLTLAESLFEAEKVSQIDSAYQDKSKHCYVLNVLPGNDPFIEMMFGAMTADKQIDPIPCSDYKVLQLAIKTDPTKTSYTGTMYYSTDVFTGYGETKNKHYSYGNDTGIIFINIDFSGEKLWDGNASNIRFDMFEDVFADTEVDFYYAAFFADMEAAEEFSAKYLEWDQSGGEFPAEYPKKAAPAATQEPTDAPEATTAPENSDIPENTNGSGTTADPGKDVNTPEGSSGDTDKSKSSFPVVPVVIGAAVLVIAVIAVVIIAAKKKKH